MNFLKIEITCDPANETESKLSRVKLRPRVCIFLLTHLLNVIRFTLYDERHVSTRVCVRMQKSACIDACPNAWRKYILMPDTYIYINRLLQRERESGFWKVKITCEHHYKWERESEREKVSAIHSFVSRCVCTVYDIQFTIICNGYFLFVK